MQDYVQDETPKRPVKDRLGTRRSKRNVRPLRPFDPLKLGWALSQEAPNSIEKHGTGIKLDTGTNPRQRQ